MLSSCSGDEEGMTQVDAVQVEDETHSFIQCKLGI